jgi:transcriptional regulator with XRE-family HTH domain
MTEMVMSTRTGWTADDSTFGARLALIRQRMGWGNVKQAAAACGLPPESWRRWERDGRSPRDILDIAAVIAERTGCDYGWLLAGARLTSYAATRAGKGPEINSRYSAPTEKTRPPGHPKDATPHWSTRRPGRLIPDLARA